MWHSSSSLPRGGFAVLLLASFKKDAVEKLIAAARSIEFLSIEPFSLGPGGVVSTLRWTLPFVSAGLGFAGVDARFPFNVIDSEHPFVSFSLLQMPLLPFEVGMPIVEALDTGVVAVVSRKPLRSATSGIVSSVPL